MASTRLTRSPGVMVVALFLLAVVAGASAAVWLAVEARPTIWTSSANVVYGAQSSDRLLGSSSQSGDVQRTLATQTQVVLGDDVMEAAAKELDVDLVDLVEDTSVENLTDSNVLRISVEATSPSRAAEAAQIVADAYVTYSRDLARDRLATQADALNQPVAQLREILAQLIGEERTPNTNALNASLTALLQQQLQLTAAAQSEDGPAQIIATAQEPRDPSSMSPLTGAFIGGVLGLVVVAGLLLAAVSWRHRDTGRRVAVDRS